MVLICRIIYQRAVLFEFTWIGWYRAYGFTTRSGGICDRIWQLLPGFRQLLNRAGRNGKNWRAWLSCVAMKKISRLYLILVPFVAAAIGFGIGHSHYIFYIPIWAVHATLMVTAAWLLGAHVVKGPDVELRYLALIAIFMIAPWMFFSIFAGMGPPPSTAQGWVETARECAGDRAGPAATRTAGTAGDNELPGFRAGDTLYHALSDGSGLTGADR